MGLDQYAYARKGQNQDVEIAYWRKHNALHGWMEELWNAKGNPNAHEGDPDFNCVPVELTADDIDALERHVLDDTLPETHGFFFGSDSRGDEYKRNATLDFISEARERLANGFQVFYSSWW